MQNDFDKWNKIKKEIDIRPSIQFHTREIWYCSVGQNVGREENGKHESFERPILVLRKFSNDLFLGLPLSSRYKDLPYYYLLDYEEISSVLLSQIRVLDAKRLIRKVRTIKKAEFDNIRIKFRDLV